MRAFLLLSLLAALPLAIATHPPERGCVDPADGVLPYRGAGIVEITTGVEAGTFYLDDRNHLEGYGIWVYEETNGVWASHGLPGAFRDDLAAHNLQRGGVSMLGDEEFCFDAGVPDRAIY